MAIGFPLQMDTKRSRVIGGIVSILAGCAVILTLYDMWVTSPFSYRNMYILGFIGGYIFSLGPVVIGLYIALFYTPEKINPQHPGYAALIFFIFSMLCLLFTVPTYVVDCSQPQSAYWWSVRDYNPKCFGTLSSSGFASCQECTSNSMGWCGTAATEGKCLPGTSSGPSYTSCSSPNAWFVSTSACPTVKFIEFYETGDQTCQNMTPIVAQVESETSVNFEKLEIFYNVQNWDIYVSYADYIKRDCGNLTVPTFFALKDNRAICGEKSASELKQFVIENG